MIISVPWLELSEVQQRDLLAALEDAFGKRVRDRERFWNCRVSFYYPRRFGSWTGAAITWSARGGKEKVVYMDKFFVRKSRAEKGEGTRFLEELTRSVSEETLLWRTDVVLAERFYGRMPGVRTLARHGEYVYQAFYPGSNGKGDQEMLLELTRIPSAF